MQKLYTTKEIAELLKIKKNTVYELIKRGELTSSKIGKQLRISDTQLEEYLKLNNINHSDIEQSNIIEYSLPKHESPGNCSSLIICGQDPSLDILCSIIESHPKGIPTLRSYVGSYNSLYALYFDRVHIATSHLWNSIDNSYNSSYISHLLPGLDTTTIRLFKRMQGFYVLKGNPKNIYSFKDLIKKDVVFVNREKGSGTRVLLDEHLLRESIPNNSITGYNNELLSHSACASEISMGQGDVALGCEHAIKRFPNLEFIPIQQECYDLIMKPSLLSRDLYNTIIEIINSLSFKTQISYLTGYDISETGNIISLN